MERLDNIMIEEYGFGAADQCILALVKLYFNTAADGEQEIKLALESEEGLAEVLKRANESVVVRGSYEPLLQKMLRVFQNAFDAEAFAEKLGEAMKPFLLDCQRELTEKS